MALPLRSIQTASLHCMKILALFYVFHSFIFIYILFLSRLHFNIVPPSKIFVYVNPVQINFHLDSVLWLNSFALNLHENILRTSMNTSMESNRNQNEPGLMYMDVKMEAIMPRVIIESSIDAPNQRDRPKLMQIQVSRFALTNIRETGSSRADLANALHSLQEGSLVFASEFPSRVDDMSVVTDRILSHMSGETLNYIFYSLESKKLQKHQNSSVYSFGRNIKSIIAKFGNGDYHNDAISIKIRTVD